MATTKGGLAIGISPALHTFVTHSHASPCGRALFVHLDGLPIGPIGLLDVYGPHTIVERIQLWKTILLSVDGNRLWILGGIGILLNPQRISLEAPPMISQKKKPLVGILSRWHWNYLTSINHEMGYCVIHGITTA